MASRKDYYDILGIRRGATEEEIEKAYQKLARTYQSAPQPGNRTADFRFREIAEAYEILSNKARRERYDRLGIDFPFQEDLWYEMLEEGEEENSLDGFEDLWEPGFDRGRLGAEQTSSRGKDIHVTLEIDLEGAARGAAKKVQVLQEIPCVTCGASGVNAEGPREFCGQCGGAGQIQVGLPPSASAKKCDRCQGTGKVYVQRCQTCAGKGWVGRRRAVTVQIPPGVNDHCRLYLLHLGHAGKAAGPNGDLVAEIRVKPHPLFERKGDDLYAGLPLAIWEAALGTEVEVPTLEGMARVKIPAGVQSGDQVRIPRRGIPFLQGEGRGNLILRLKIQVPREVDEKSKKILEELERRGSSVSRWKRDWTGRSGNRR
jgi:molecular chaperone DnaJ